MTQKTAELEKCNFWVYCSQNIGKQHTGEPVKHPPKWRTIKIQIKQQTHHQPSVGASGRLTSTEITLFLLLTADCEDTWLHSSSTRVLVAVDSWPTCWQSHESVIIVQVEHTAEGQLRKTRQDQATVLIPTLVNWRHTWCRRNAANCGTD